jgi:hypothetical protein
MPGAQRENPSRTRHQDSDETSMSNQTRIDQSRLLDYQRQQMAAVETEEWARAALGSRNSNMLRALR